MIILSAHDELFQQMYQHELEQRERINNRIQIPIAVVTLLIGAVVYYAPQLKDISYNYWGFTFYQVFILFCVFVILTIYFIFRSYYGYTYAYLPMPSNIDSYVQQLEIHFSNDPQKEQIIEDRLKKFRRKMFGRVAEHNALQNEKKSKYVRLTGWSLVIALILGAISVMPFYKSHNDEQKDPVKVKIENIKDFTSVQGGDTNVRR